MIYYVEREDIAVIAGMNFPMVLEAVLNEQSSIDDIIQSGKDQIFALANRIDQQEEKQVPATNEVERFDTEKRTPGILKNIRVDYRGVHGQVATQRIPQLSVNRVILIDTKTTENPHQKKAIRMATPENVRLSILSASTASEGLKHLESYAGENILIVLLNLQTFEVLYDQGIHFDDITLGNIPNRDGTTRLANTVYITQEEKTILKSLIDQDTNIHLQMVPGDPEIDANAMIKEDYI